MKRKKHERFPYFPTSPRNLREKAAWLNAHSEFSIVVEGHCDQRGTLDSTGQGEEDHRKNRRARIRFQSVTG